MKIDMFLIWIIAGLLIVGFQMFFTVNKTSWDVAYTYTNDTMDYIAYGRRALIVNGDSLPWGSAEDFLEKNIQEEIPGGGPVGVVVLNTNKVDSERVLFPFWEWVKK